MKKISKKEELLKLGEELCRTIDEDVDIFINKGTPDARLKNKAKRDFLCDEIAKYK